MALNNFVIKQPFVVDVSSHEDKQDWSKITPRPFAAIARATFSNWLLDKSLAHNWAEWRYNGIRKTAYGFPQPMHSADDQAKFFVKTMKAVGGWDEGDLPPVLDFETAGFTAHQIKVYLDRVEGEFGMKPIIYTRRDIWETICTTKLWVTTAPSWTNDYLCWVGWYPFANYIDRNNTVPKNRMPRGWKRWALWQYSEAGRLAFDKVNGYDFNVMAEWYAQEILNQPEPPPIPEPPITGDEPTDEPEENNGDDMTEEALYNIADAIRYLADSGGYVPPIDNGEDKPPVEPEKIMRTIKPRWWNGSFPVYRTPDINANKVSKIRLVLVPGQQVEEREPPKRIHKSFVWDTPVQLHNFYRNWVWLPQQNVILDANKKMVELPTWHIQDWDIIWHGVFVETKYLLEKEA